MDWKLHISKNWAWSAATKSLGLLLLVASFMFLSTSARAEEPSATVDDTVATVDDTTATVDDTTDTVDDTTDTIDDTTDTIDETTVPRDELVTIADATTSQVKQPIEDEQTSDLAPPDHRPDGDITRSLIEIVVSPSEPFNETSLTAMWTNLRSAAISLGSAGGPGTGIGLVAVLIQLPPVVSDLTRRLGLAASQGPKAAHALAIDIPG